jgi:hypothetical protein
VVQQELAEDIDMDPGTKKPELNMRELRKKRGVNVRDVVPSPCEACETRNASSSAADDMWSRSLELFMK